MESQNALSVPFAQGRHLARRAGFLDGFSGKGNPTSDDLPFASFATRAGIPKKDTATLETEPNRQAAKRKNHPSPKIAVQNRKEATASRLPEKRRRNGLRLLPPDFKSAATKTKPELECLAGKSAKIRRRTLGGIESRWILWIPKNWGLYAKRPPDLLD